MTWTANLCVESYSSAGALLGHQGPRAVTRHFTVLRRTLRTASVLPSAQGTAGTATSKTHRMLNRRSTTLTVHEGPAALRHTTNQSLFNCHYINGRPIFLKASAGASFTPKAQPPGHDN